MRSARAVVEAASFAVTGREVRVLRAPERGRDATIRLASLVLVAAALAAPGCGTMHRTFVAEPSPAARESAALAADLLREGRLSEAVQAARRQADAARARPDDGGSLALQAGCGRRSR